MSSQQLSLLDPPADPAPSLDARFEAWIAWRESRGLHPLRSTSLSVYRDMWRTLGRALQRRGGDPLRLEEGDLAAVIESVDASTVYRKRLLALLDGVLQAAGREPRSSAAWRLLQREPYRLANTREDERQPVTLGPSQQARLLARLAEPSRDGPWQRQRDRAIAALIFGAGLKPGEAVKLEQASLVFDEDEQGRRRLWKLSLAGRAGTGPRETPVAPWAATVMHDWLAARDRLGIRGADTRFVFPARLGDDRPIDRSTFYRQFARLLGELGIQPPKKGGHVLRHTFAVRQLAEEPDLRTLRKVSTWMGIERLESAMPYARIVGRDTRVV